MYLLTAKLGINVRQPERPTKNFVSRSYDMSLFMLARVKFCTYTEFVSTLKTQHLQ